MDQKVNHCPICGSKTAYNPRYPKALCRECLQKPAYSLTGELLEFYNQSLSGGLKVVFKDADGNTIREDNTLLECDCMIDNVLCVAEEGRFGGIIIQKKG